MPIDITPPLAPLPDGSPNNIGPYRVADYDRLPEGARYELLFGWFYPATPVPGVLQHTLAQILFLHLNGIAAGAGAFAFMAPVEVLLDQAPAERDQEATSVLRPDVLYVAASRQAILKERLLGMPNLFVDVLPPVLPRDREEKSRLYAAAGVPEYWIADPQTRTIDFYRNLDGRFVAELPVNGVYQSSVPEVTLDVAELWQTFESRLPPFVPR